MTDWFISIYVVYCCSILQQRLNASWHFVQYSWYLLHVDIIWQCVGYFCLMCLLKKWKRFCAICFLWENGNKYVNMSVNKSIFLVTFFFGSSYFFILKRKQQRIVTVSVWIEQNTWKEFISIENREMIVEAEIFQKLNTLCRIPSECCQQSD